MASGASQGEPLGVVGALIGAGFAEGAGACPVDIGDKPK